MIPKLQHGSFRANEYQCTLKRKEMYLVGQDFTITKDCVYCSVRRLAVGITQQLGNVAVILAAAFNAGGGVLTALIGLERKEKDGSCDGGTCAVGI